MRREAEELRDLRVLIVGNWPPPLGGVSVHVRALRDAAQRAGASVTVLDIGAGQNALPGVVPSGREVRFARRLLSLLSRSDVVHLHTSGANAKSWLLTAGIGAVARLKGVTALVTFHSGHGPRYLQTTPRALAARAALAPYERVVCVSEEISRSLGRIGAAPRRHVVAPAYGAEGAEPSALPAAAGTFILGHYPVVAAMLAPGRDYGAPELFAAFARLRRDAPLAALLVYGPGTDRVETAPLAGDAASVLRLGEIQRGEALAVVRASDLFVRPTLVDGDAVSVREALALGRRVVATRVGSRPMGVTLCAPGDAPDLARAMLESLTRPPLSRGPDTDGIASVLRLYAQRMKFRAPPSVTSAA